MQTNLIKFNDHYIQAIKGDDGQIFVPIKPICEKLGIQVHIQIEKMKREPEVWSVTLLSSVAADGKSYQTNCLPLDKLPLWLATIDTGRVKPETKPMLIAYKLHCAQVLSDYFYGTRAAELNKTQLQFLGTSQRFWRLYVSARQHDNPERAIKLRSKNPYTQDDWNILVNMGLAQPHQFPTANNDNDDNQPSLLESAGA